jgi:hypothetical protein
MPLYLYVTGVRNGLRGGALGALLIGLLAACTSAAPKPSATPASTAAVALRQLSVRSWAPMTGYARRQFGPAWADVDHNGCDTRNDILNRDLTAKQWRAGTHDCVVVAGDLNEPYSGAAMHFLKSDASAVQIDHVVALGDAWQTGAAAWDAARREAFANDPRNLLAVDGRLNEAKGDADAASWLPPRAAAQCAYVVRQIAVKRAYGLWVTPAEHDAMARVLAGCPGAQLPS